MANCLTSIFGCDVPLSGHWMELCFVVTDVKVQTNISLLSALSRNVLKGTLRVEGSFLWPVNINAQVVGYLK